MRIKHHLRQLAIRLFRIGSVVLVAFIVAACGEGSLDPLVAKGNGAEILEAVSASTVVSTPVPANEFARQALDAMNVARAAGQICGEDFYPPAGPVLWNDRIAHAALLESQWMQRDNDFGHAWPDGTRVGNRLDTANYLWRHADENIAAGFRTLPAAIQAWIDSPPHCRALMRQDVSEGGMAVVPGDANNTYVAYWTMVLAEPAAEAIGVGPDSAQSGRNQLLATISR